MRKRLAPPVQYFLIFSLVLLLLFTIFRLLFFLKYFDQFRNCSAEEIFIGFLNGVRFDLSTILIVSAPFFLAAFLPFLSRSRRVIRLIGILHMFFMVPILFWLAVDLEYYSFVNRRISYEIFLLLEDASSTGKMVLLQFPIAIALFILLISGFFTIWLKLLNVPIVQEKRQYSIIKETALLSLFLVTAVVGIRGGLQYKPLRVSYAFQNEKPVLGHLALNGVYTTIQTIRKPTDESIMEWNAQKEDVVLYRSIIDSDTSTFLDEDFPVYRRFIPMPRSSSRVTMALKPIKSQDSAAPYNVVILIMESWPAFEIKSLGGEHDCAPQFDKLARNGLLLTNCMATGQRSIDGIPSILGSLPALPKASIIMTSLEQNRYTFLPSLLKSRGYSTLFLHGGRRETMGFNGFAKIAGFDRHISREDFDDPERVDDGVWGIWDEYAFQRLNRELTRMTPPFFGTIFTLSSHGPYRIPSEKFKKFDESIERSEFLNVMNYSDYALGQFFKAAEKEDYFKNTLFVITADHTDAHFRGRGIYDNYRIPCLYYAPSLIKPSKYEDLTTQMDILPTILDILGIEDDYAAFGNSLFSPDRNSYAVINRDPLIAWIEGSYLSLFNGENNVGLFDLYGDKQMESDLSDRFPQINQTLQHHTDIFTKMTYRLLYTNHLVPNEPVRPR